MGGILLAAVVVCGIPLPAVQEKNRSEIAREAEKRIGEIESGGRGGLFDLFDDSYVPTLEWEPGLVPVLIKGLRIDNHSVQFSIDRIFNRVTGVQLIWLAGSTFEAVSGEGQERALEWLEKWWETYGDRTRVDWFIAALGNRSLELRRMGIAGLSSLFNKSFGYEPEGEEKARAEAIGDWKAFWKKNRRAFRYDEDKAFYVADEGDRAAADDRERDKRIGEWIGQLGDPDIAVREAATERLIDAGQAARPMLEKAAESDNLEVRYRARMILEAEKALTGPATLREEVRKILRSPDAAAIIAGLAKKRDLRSALILAEILQSYRAATLIEELADRAARDPKIAWALARSIRKSGPGRGGVPGGYVPSPTMKSFTERGAVHLIPYLSDASPGVRMAVSGMLALLGTKHLKELREKLTDSDKRIRLAVIQGLGHSGDAAAAETLLERAKTDGSWDNRRWAALAVGRLKAESALDELGEIARNGEEHIFVSGAAAEAIGMIGSMKGIPVLEKCLEARKGDLDSKSDEYSRRYVPGHVLGAFYRILDAHPSEKDAWKAIERLFLHEESGIRFLAVQYAVYARLKDRDVRATLKEFLQGAANDKDERVREEAERALKRWR